MLQGGATPLGATVINLSVGGVLVETDEALDAQESVKVVLDTRGATGEVNSCVLRGRVLRSEPVAETGRQRVAIAFFDPLSDEQLLRHGVGSRRLTSVGGGRP